MITYEYPLNEQRRDESMASLCAQAEDAVRSGYTILIISDREFEADHEDLIYHLDFPFEPDALRDLVLALLDRTETNDKHLSKNNFPTLD